MKSSSYFCKQKNGKVHLICPYLPAIMADRTSSFEFNSSPILKMTHFVSLKNFTLILRQLMILPQKSRPILTLISKNIFGAFCKQPLFQGKSWILPWFQVNLDFKRTVLTFSKQPWFQGNLNFSRCLTREFWRQRENYPLNIGLLQVYLFFIRSFFDTC